MSAENNTGWPGALDGGAIDSALPLFGPLSYFQITASFMRPLLSQASRKQNLKLVELHKKHGHFVRISHDEVSVALPNAIKALYLNPIPKGNWYRVFVFPDWRFPLSMSTQDPKKKADFTKYLSNAGFSLTNILQREPDMDKQIKLPLGWIDKYINF